MRCLVCLQVLAFSLVLQTVTSKPFSQSSANSHGEAFEWHARKVGDKRVAIVSIKKDPNRDRRSVFNDSSGRTSRHHHGHHRFSQAPEEHYRRGASGRGGSDEWRDGGKGEEPTRGLHRRTGSQSSAPPYDHPGNGLHGHHHQSRHEGRRARHHDEYEDEDRSRISLRQSHHRDHSNTDSRPASLRHHNGRDRNRSPLALISTRSPDVQSDLYEDEDDDEEDQEEELEVDEEEEDLTTLDLSPEPPKRRRSHLTHTSHTTEDLIRRYGRDQVSYSNETRPSRAAKRRMKKKNGRGTSKKGEKKNKKRRDKKKRRERKRKKNKKKKGRRNRLKGRQGRKRKKGSPSSTNESAIDLPGAINTELTGSDACQYKNMLKCGRNTGILEHTDNINDVDSQLVRKCFARQEFFTCMEKEREKPCNANLKATGDMSRLRGRIRDAIWTSGNCIVNQMRVPAKTESRG